MAITLNPDTEHRVQQEVSDGKFDGPDELINFALDVMTEDTATRQERAAISARLDRAWDELQSGAPGISGERLEAMLVERRAKRVA